MVFFVFSAFPSFVRLHFGIPAGIVFSVFSTFPSFVRIPVYRREWFFPFSAHSHPLSARIPRYIGGNGFFSTHSRPLGQPENGLSALGRGLPALSRHPGRDNHILFFVNPIRRKEHRRILQRTQHTKFRHRLLRETKVPLKTDAVSLPDIKRKENEKTVKTIRPAGLRFKKPVQAKKLSRITGVLPAFTPFQDVSFLFSFQSHAL